MMEEICEKFLAEFTFINGMTGAELMKLHPRFAEIDDFEKRKRALYRYASKDYEFESLREECSRMFGFEIGSELGWSEKKVILGQDERRDRKIK